MESAVLDMKVITGRHTGETIGKMIKEVLEDWKITNVTQFAITDNGSNVVKAFKVVQEMYLAEHNCKQREKETETEIFEESDSSADDTEIENENNGIPVNPGNYLVVLFG